MPKTTLEIEKVAKTARHGKLPFIFCQGKKVN